MASKCPGLVDHIPFKAIVFFVLELIILVSQSKDGGFLVSFSDIRRLKLP